MSRVTRLKDPGSAASTPPVEEWPHRACRDQDAGLFYPDHAAHYDLPASICGRCENEIACLKWALDTRQQFGMWGGKTPDQRLVLLARM